MQKVIRNLFRSIPLVVLCVTGIAQSAIVSPKTIGYSPGTQIDLQLAQWEIYRADWLSSTMPGTVRILNGRSLYISSRIQLYGDRANPLYPGETDWKMLPYPVNYYLRYDELSFTYNFPIGPNYVPAGENSWLQQYIYTAMTALAYNGTTILDSEGLNVHDSLGYLNPNGSIQLSTLAATDSLSSESVAMDTSTAQSTLNALYSPDKATRVRAALALGKSRVTSAGGPLLAALNESDADMRWAAAYSLGLLQYSPALPALCNRVKNDSDILVRASCAAALGAFIGQGDVLSPLLQACADPESIVRNSAYRALAKSKDPQVLAANIAGVDDTDKGVRLYNIAALGHKRAVSGQYRLISVLQTGDTKERCEAALALGSIGSSQAIAALVDALQNAESPVNKAAAVSLRVLRDPHVTADLVTVYNDYNSAVSSLKSQQ